MYHFNYFPPRLVNQEHFLKPVSLVWSCANTQPDNENTMAFWFSQQTLSLHSALTKQASNAKKASFVPSKPGSSIVVQCSEKPWKKEQDRRVEGAKMCI